MKRVALLLASTCLLLAACGIKGAPRPPLDEAQAPAPAAPPAADAGCCAEGR